MMPNKCIGMNTKLFNYLTDHNPKENPHLIQLRQESDKLKYARLRTPTEQVVFLTFLVKYLSPKKILEIGTFTGYTTLAFALATNEEKTQITTCDINNIFPNIGKPFWQAANLQDKIELKIGPAKQTLQELIQQQAQYDFIYIDADKENTTNYLRLSLQLLSKYGLIIIDNTLRKGDVANSDSTDKQTQAMRSFNSELINWPNINYCLLPFCDGITLISKSN